MTETELQKVIRISRSSLHKISLGKRESAPAILASTRKVKTAGHWVARAVTSLDHGLKFRVLPAVFF